MKPVRRSGVVCVLVGAGLVAATSASVQEYEFRIVASGLSRPVGIAVDGENRLVFTQVPTPGVPAGLNGVFRLDLESNEVTTLHLGEPEPTNIALDANGDVYWTCKSAGVILKQDPEGNTVLFLGKLEKPTGIGLDRDGLVYFTEVPVPGVVGVGNRLSVSDGSTTTILHMGEPEPTDVVVSKKGEIYWTCKSAGVILEQVGGETTMLLTGLDHPSGIALDKNDDTLYFTEVPTPGIAGNAGGRNKVWKVDLKTLARTLVHQGDPEPTDVAVAHDGSVYWTCTSAGVIVEAKPTRKK